MFDNDSTDKPNYGELNFIYNKKGHNLIDCTKLLTFDLSQSMHSIAVINHIAVP